MNNRITELAEQAEDAVDWGDPHNHDHRIQGDIEFRQRFAQLIVQDCLKLVEKRTGGSYEITMSPETRRSWNIWIEIKEHFGVK